ncbi:MAG: amino acid permease [Alphaproteobacteria bacterium]
MVQEQENTATTLATGRPFGFWTAVSLVIGNMVGTGIYPLPAALAIYGSLSLIGFALAAVGAMCLAYIFAHLTIHNPKSGGPYTHGQAVFGDLIGFLVAWGYWIMNWTGSAATAIGIVGYLSIFVPELVHNRLLAFEYGMAIVWSVTIINCLGLRFGGAVQVVFTAVKLIPLIVIPIVALFWFNSDNFFLSVGSAMDQGHTTFSAINASATIAMWSFIGLEAATVPAERIANPERTIARATIFGTALVAIVYLITNVALFGAVPIHTLATSSAPFVDVAKVVFGEHVAPLIALCIIISGLGGINGWILLHGQIPQVMAKDGLFPRQFLKTSADGTPVLGLVVGSILITLLMIASYQDSLLQQFVLIITVGGVMTLFAYLVSSFAALFLLKGKKTLTPVFKIVCIAAIAYSLWAIAGAGTKVLMFCVVGYCVGVPLYIYVRRRGLGLEK